MNPPARPMLEVGHVARAHGLRGEVVVALLTDRHERLAPGFRLASDVGELVVAGSRPFGERWLVTFEGVVDRNAAERLAGAVLRAEPIDDPAELWVHELVGAVVVERDGTVRGRVVAVQANPAADLLVLDNEALVPLTFVVEADVGSPGPPAGAGRIVIDSPPGLFD